MKFLSVLLALSLTMMTGCNKVESIKDPVEKKPDTSRIYFSARAVPGANIYSINLDKDLTRHTYNPGGRDNSLSLDNNGNLFFTSSRILPEDRAARSKIGKRGNRRQDLNALYLKAGVIEEQRGDLTQSMGKTNMPESATAISKNGKLLSFVRTVIPEGANKQSKSALESVVHDELYVQAGLEGKPKKISNADVIVKPKWSNDNKKLVFSSYDNKNKVAQLSVYNIETGTTELLLENPWGINQIDNPQWSPDGQYISLMLHPIEKKKLKELYVLDIKSKNLKKLSKELESVHSSASWSSDSKKIAYAARVDDGNFSVRNKRAKNNIASHIFVVGINGEHQQLTKEPSGINSNPVFSPNNQHIAFKRAEEVKSRKAKLFVIDLKTDSTQALYEGLMRRGHMIWQ